MNFGRRKKRIVFELKLDDYYFAKTVCGNAGNICARCTHENCRERKFVALQS